MVQKKKENQWTNKTHSQDEILNLLRGVKKERKIQ